MLFRSMVLTVMTVSSLVWLPIAIIIIVSMPQWAGSVPTDLSMMVGLIFRAFSILVLTPLDIGIQAALYRSLKARHNPVEDPQDSGARD